MKKIKKNIVITGYELHERPDFISDIEHSTGIEWGWLGLKSNHKRRGIHSEVYRYFLYAFYSFIILLLCCNSCNNIICTQQFYGLIVAFYSRILHLRKKYSLTVFTFIYKPKKGIVGKIYFHFMECIVNSKYIDGIVVYSKNEVDYYETLFKCRKGLFHYVQLGKGDESKSHICEKGNYLISVGRSNRDYDWLISSLANTDYKLIIINDSFCCRIKSDNVQVLTSCYENEMLEHMAKSFCVVVPLLDPNISAGQLVVLQGQNLHKPVIATESKGIENYIINNKTGFLIKKDKDDLLKTLQKLKDDSIYNNVSECGYKSFIFSTIQKYRIDCQKVH